MTTYIRTEVSGAMQRVTEVTEDGAYHQRAVWPDGIVTSEYRSTLQNMGWSGLHEFLREKGASFKKVCKQMIVIDSK